MNIHQATRMPTIVGTNVFPMKSGGKSFGVVVFPEFLKDGEFSEPPPA